MSKNKKYIYESPDGGKTIYRREFGNYDTKEKLCTNVEVPEGYWVCSHDVEWVCEEL